MGTCEPSVFAECVAHAKGQTPWQNNEKVTESRICILLQHQHQHQRQRQRQLCCHPAHLTHALLFALSLSIQLVQLKVELFHHVRRGQSRRQPVEIGASNWFVRTKLIATQMANALRTALPSPPSPAGHGQSFFGASPSRGWLLT